MGLKAEKYQNVSHFFIDLKEKTAKRISLAYKDKNVPHDVVKRLSFLANKR